MLPVKAWHVFYVTKTAFFPAFRKRVETKFLDTYEYTKGGLYHIIIEVCRLLQSLGSRLQVRGNFGPSVIIFLSSRLIDLSFNMHHTLKIREHAIFVTLIVYFDVNMQFTCIVN